MTALAGVALLAAIFIGAVIATFWDDIKKAFKRR
jgi:hypothetical protein